MTTEIKDQTKRKQQIALLEAGVAKLDAQLVEVHLLHARLEQKLINRCAELRCQKILLNMAERAALKAAKATPV